MSVPRCLTACAVVLSGLVIALAVPFSHRLPTQVFGWTLVIGAPLFLYFATEPDRLDPRALQRVAQGGWTRALFVPGGGRGLALLFVCLSWLVGAQVLGRVGLPTGVPLLRDDDPTQFALAGMYVWLYVALPSTLCARRPSGALYTWLVRYAAAGAVVGSWFLSLLLPPSLALSILLYPFALLEAVKGDGGVTSDFAHEARVLVVLFFLSVALCLPRMLAGLREVRDGPTSRSSGTRSRAGPS